ncbi:MAG: hypothetical protein JXX14_06370 [Deltaproteobacteria bacterium]|nr:hypothetical protein [Deltaproteobacteria bacterium]
MYCCRWFVLCENVVVDATTNNLTMVNALSVLRTHTFPAHHLRFSFAAILDQKEAEGPLSLRFVREMKEKDEILFTTGTFDQAPKVAQFFLNFPMGIRLFEKGTVTFRVEAKEGDLDWYSVGSQSLLVEHFEPAPASDAKTESTE